MDIKSLFGLQTKADKINEYKRYLKSLHKIEDEVSLLGDNFKFQKSQYDDLANEEGEIKAKAQERFNSFLKQQSQDIQSLYKRKVRLEKAISTLENDPEIDEILKEIKSFDSMRENWKKGLIKKSVYMDFLKAKHGGKTKFSDVLIFRGSKLLILQRAGEGGSHTDEWCIPGGHVDVGENFYEAASRELFEETGIEVPSDLLSEVAVYENKDIEIHYFMAWLSEDAPSMIVVDGFEEIGSAWIDPYTEIDDYKFIFDMKDNIKKILGIPIEDDGTEKMVMNLAKGLSEGKVSETIFLDFCQKHRDSIEKAKNKNYFSHKERKDLAEKGEAMPNGKYPIRNSQDLKDAIRLSGSSDEPKEEVKSWIKKRAKELGLESELPEDWIEKDMGVESAQTLSKESLDEETKGPQGSGIGDDDFKKAITFKKIEYAPVTKEANENVYRNGEICLGVSDESKGEDIEKLTEILAIIEKLAYQGDKGKFTIKIETENNGDQEWKFKEGFRIYSVKKTEYIQKSQEDDFNKSGIELSLSFNDLEEADVVKSLFVKWNDEGKVNLKEEPLLIDHDLEKSEREKKSDFKSYLNFLEGIKTRIKGIHWEEEDNSKHKYLDDLADEVGEFEDKFAEAGQAGFGRFKEGEIVGEEIDEGDPVKLIDLIIDRTKDMRSKIEGNKGYIGEVSWIDDFLASLKQSKYRMQMK